jgi:hypothetical protein
MFAASDISIGSDFPDARVAGKKWKELGEAERRIFWNYVLPVELLDFESGETGAVNDAFDRLNRNSRRLEPQELRHARFDGWFMNTVEVECQDASWRTLGVVTNARAKRMKDAQVISELLLVVLENRQLGFDQQHLDEAYAKYDDSDDEGVELDTEVFDTSLTSAKDFLVAMNAINGCVRGAAATVGAFYTLWSLVVLHRDEIPAATELAERYIMFTSIVARVRATANTAQLELPGSQEAWREPALQYAKAMAGAHTDQAPRTMRLAALLQAMRTS